MRRSVIYAVATFLVRQARHCMWTVNKRSNKNVAECINGRARNEVVQATVTRRFSAPTYLQRSLVNSTHRHTGLYKRTHMRRLTVSAFFLGDGRCPVCLSACWMDQDETWHGGRPRPRPHCVRWAPSSFKGAQYPPPFGLCLLWPNGRPSQLLVLLWRVRHPTAVDLSPHLPYDNIHCQTPLKNPLLTYFALTNASWQLLLRIEIG